VRETVALSLKVNGVARSLTVEPRETLAEVVRDRLGLTGTKISCDAQVCGACTLLVDGLPISGCTYLAVDADERDVRSVEGLRAPDGTLSPLQQAFIDHAAFQCGFCTAGFLMSATALLEENPRPTREEVIHGLEGNICRCTGYEPIVNAVLAAAGADPGAHTNVAHAGAEPEIDEGAGGPVDVGPETPE
jgi:aerobic-type carbon monoxide dehydrogenase small subunit (CoxS/CutS family)